MVDHNEYKKMLVEFIYGEISSEREEALLEHLSHCAQCRQDLRELLQARDFASGLRKNYPSPPVVVEERVSFPWAALVFLLMLFLLFFNLPKGAISSRGQETSQPQWEVLTIENPDFSVALEDYQGFFSENLENENKNRR